MKRNKNKTRVFSMAKLIYSILILAMIFAAPANLSSAQDPCTGGSNIGEITRLETLLTIPCDDVLKVMNRLVYLGNNHISLNRAYNARYRTEAGGEWKARSQFISIVTEKLKKQGIVPGEFFRRYQAMRKEARDAGVLAEADLPPNIGWEKAAVIESKSPDRAIHFYFSPIGSDEAKKRKEKRWELEDRYQKLLSDWAAAKNAYEKKFTQKYIDEVNTSLVSQKKNLEKIYLEYRSKKGELSKLAMNGKYEHCLGPLDLNGPHYEVVMAGKGTGTDLSLYNFNPAWAKADKPPIESLPGMGFNLKLPAPYSISKVKIPDFAFKLYLKRNGSDYLKLYAERLKIKIQGEEEAALAIGRSWRNIMLVGLPSLIGEENIEAIAGKDINANTLKAFGFLYGCTYETVKAAAPVGDLLIHVGSHPIDSTTSIYNTVTGIPAGVQKIMTMPIDQLDARLNAPGNAMVDAVHDLWDGGKEAFNDLVDPSRFEAKENETLRDQVLRLEERYEADLKMSRATEITQKIIGEVVNFATANAQVKAGAKILQGIKGVANLTGGGIVKIAQMSAKGEAALARLQALKKEAALTKAKIPEGLSSKLKKLDVMKYDDLAQQQMKLGKEIQEFVDPPPRISGKALTEIPEAEKTIIKVKDAKGNVIELTGKKLGQGSTSTAYLNGANDAEVIRVTSLNTKEARMANAYDEYGRKVLEEKVQSESIRVAKREKILTGEGGTHVEIVENVSGEGFVTYQHGTPMSNGQKLAWEKGMRDLNSKGYCWLDNHHGNFQFEKLPGQDRWRVVVLDPGNIVPMKGATLAERSTNAKALQQKVAQCTAGDLTKLPEDIRELAESGFQNSPMLWGAIRERILEENAIDFAAMGEKFSETNLGLAGKLGVRPETWDLAQKTDQAIAKTISQNTKTQLDALNKQLEAGVKKMADAEKVYTQTAEKLALLLKQSGKKGGAGGADQKDEESAKKEAEAFSASASDSISVIDCATYKERILSGIDPEELKKIPDPCKADEQPKAENKK